MNDFTKYLIAIISINLIIISGLSIEKYLNNQHQEQMAKISCMKETK